jgi:hypothetical protein
MCLSTEQLFTTDYTQQMVYTKKYSEEGHKLTFITCHLLLYNSHWGPGWRLSKWMAPTLSSFGLSLYCLVIEQKWKKSKDSSQ